MKLNQNRYKNETFLFYLDWFLYKIFDRIAFNMFEKKTIISEINSTK